MVHMGLPWRFAKLPTKACLKAHKARRQLPAAQAAQQRDVPFPSLMIQSYHHKSRDGTDIPSQTWVWFPWLLDRGCGRSSTNRQTGKLRCLVRTWRGLCQGGASPGKSPHPGSRCPSQAEHSNPWRALESENRRGWNDHAYAPPLLHKKKRIPKVLLRHKRQSIWSLKLITLDVNLTPSQ